MKYPLRILPVSSHLRVLLFFSGFSALALEIAYTRLFRYWVGNTAVSAAIVLVSYMLGLALGSFLAAWLLPRLTRLLTVFGALEFCLGLLSLSLPWLLDRCELPFTHLAIRLGFGQGTTFLGQFALSVLILLPPTIMMGMSFPVAVRAASGGHSDRSRVAEKLYAANLTGAALGALFSDFVLIPFWGLGSSLLFAAATNTSVALWVFWLDRSGLAQVKDEAHSEFHVSSPQPGGEVGVIMWVALAGGFLVLFQEIVWNHMLGEFLDNSAYGFAIMLFAIIAGLGAGASLSVRYLSNRSAPKMLPWFFLGAGGTSMLLIPFWDYARELAHQGPEWSIWVAVSLMLFLGVIAFPEGRGPVIAVVVVLIPLAAVLLGHWISPRGSAFWVHHFVDFCVSILFMLIPAVFMGFVFPLVMQWFLESGGNALCTVGLVYGANTLGSVLGIITATFLVIPRIGVESSGHAVGLAFFVLGLWLFVLKNKRAWPVTLAIVPAVAWCALFPPWDYHKTHTALGYKGEMVFAHEDINGGLTTVLQEGDAKRLYTNGLFQAGNDFEVHDQALLALAPVIHMKSFGSSMVIGLGSGQSAGILGLFPFKEITLVDLSRGVVEASERFFTELNLGILHDPRTTVQIDDGRHYLLTHTQKLDLLSIEVTRLWVAGEGDLYTREFYELCSSRLADEGVLEQWVPLFNLSRQDTLMVLRTIRSVFPYVDVYMGDQSGMVLASRQPLRAIYTRFEDIDSRPQIQSVLHHSGLTSSMSLLGDCVVDSQGLDALMKGQADKRVSTDLWPYLEYSNARTYFGDPHAKAVRQFLLDSQEFRLLPIEGSDAGATESIRKLAIQEHNRLVESTAKR